MPLGDFITGIGGAVSDLYAADAAKSKAQGLRLEGEQYGLASTYAEQNKAYTQQSVDLQEYQASRKINQTIGSQQAAVASSGFGEAGSALDLLRDSANQGALTKATLAQQGNITEAGYEEQAQSYNLMQQAANNAADAADKAAKGAGISAIIKGVAGVAGLFSGGFSFGGGGGGGISGSYLGTAGGAG
jgi:hypothetical protein